MAAGPPPGLGIAALPPNPFGSNGLQTSHKTPLVHHSDSENTVKYERPAHCPRTYGRGALLAFSSSALVAKPTDMASLRDWYGEWEPYHQKATYHRETPRKNFAEDSSHYQQAQTEGDEAANNGGIIGGALGGFGPKREGAGNRFGARRNEDRDRGERGEGLRLGEVGGRRMAPAGKNPFGQISASGAFKPAGTPGGGRGLPRDGNAEGLDGRRGMGERSTSYGKDRMREMLPDDRRRDPGRDRRRSERGLDGDESREEGEIYESGRKRRTGGADTASDWRRPGDRDRAGPFSSLASDRLRPSERRGAPRSGGAPWSGDADDNPAWLEDDSDPLPVDNRAPFGQFGSRRNDPDGLGDSQGGDMGGAVDSIQAFKAQMKERERRERLARGEPESEPVQHNDTYEGNHSGSFGTDRDSSREYHFGGDGGSQQTELDAIRQEMIAAANQRSSSGGSLYDSISNSHGGPGADGQGPPGLPGRSSRFARFFDGRGAPPRDPQAAALAAQQKMLESMGNLGSSNAAQPSPGVASESDKDGAGAQSPQSQPNASSSSINISELFSKTSIRDKGDGGQNKDGKDVTEADQQSMQKLMAMLQGSGGSVSGTPRLSKGPGAGDDRHSQADQLSQLLRGQQHGRNGDEGSNERPRSVVSPSLASAESLNHGLEARSPLPHNQQHQRESSTSSALGHQQQQQLPPQHRQQQQHEQYPQYQQQQQSQHQQRSESPAIGGVGGGGMPYNGPTSPGGGPVVGSPGPAPGMAGFGGFPSGMPGRPPPPGMDPRLIGRPPMGGPGFQQIPPHIAASLGLARGPMPPGMGNMPPPPPMGVPGGPGPRGSAPNGGFPPQFAPFPGGRPPPPGMPPQLYQQLMSMPPHIQQQVLAGQGFPPGMPPPMQQQHAPRSAYDLPGTPGGGGDRRSQSPAIGGGQQQFPYYALHPGPASPLQQQQQPASPNVGPLAMGGANLMALLSGGGGGRGTPSNSS
ncbi:hypothetical protein NDA11_004003 [Ustilago hordei]|uniref:Uncharacterized protein n=1 Tax=Ustilago hordei TaxID=120017 RepID=I2FQV5_USTHO|nr:uncharacterized protein UHO2_05134 [Ustilago hordei]KAJ1043006.1 hypothetical protein NDA10_001464 [Ustilago hordei]KAJ1571171.1 hypothetical protein NDA12_001667 [Ustilago hordei]KAJ1571612.1 hypothetical protein NDA15_007848 [Ustilago hordei]KAJ1596070.1 hypothetical protein NDA11_004003 [Ustilago hordei]KAJ1596738.1 hypothetical protein NDA14_005667 [Ustilago hordei]